MAQTKTKKAKSSGARPKRKKTKSSQSRVKQAKAKSNGKVNEGAKAVRKAVGSAGKGAGRVADMASKAKAPVAAGGAVLMAAAGGAALAVASSKRKKVLGVKVPQRKRVKIKSKDLRKAAKHVGNFGDQVGELATEVKTIRNKLGD